MKLLLFNLSNSSLIVACTLETFAMVGFIMNDFPLSEPEGTSPVQIYFKASIIVVFPLPFLPIIIVNGIENLNITGFLGSYDLKPD